MRLGLALHLLELSKFPIPMRGNEWLNPSAGKPVALVFPIPMRGNETYSDIGNPRGYEFPIPMRGNESSTIVWMACSELVFPIPMRGNEVHVMQSLRPLWASVSDPHEG